MNHTVSTHLPAGLELHPDTLPATIEGIARWYKPSVGTVYISAITYNDKPIGCCFCFDELGATQDYNFNTKTYHEPKHGYGKLWIATIEPILTPTA